MGNPVGRPRDDRPCLLAHCDKPRWAQELCKSHYYQWYRQRRKAPQLAALKRLAAEYPERYEELYEEELEALNG